MIVSWPSPDQGAGHPRPVHACGRHRADDLRAARGSSCRRSSRASRSTRSRARASPRACTIANVEGQGDAVLFDARHARDLPRRLEGRVGDARRAGCLGRLRQPAVGAVQRREPIRASVHDLAEEKPEKLQELVALWWAEAGKYGALPLESRDAIGILLAPRPQLSKPRDQLHLLPGLRGGAGVGHAEHPQPLLRRRRRGEDRLAGGRAASCSRRARVSAATRST